MLRPDNYTQPSLNRIQMNFSGNAVGSHDRIMWRYRSLGVRSWVSEFLSAIKPLFDTHRYQKIR